MLDKEMREPLFDFLDEYFGKIRTLEEKIIIGSRADVLGIIDGEIIGFEIKSDSDTYTRLESQVKDYDKVCNRSFVVIGKSHLMHVAEHIPKYWGIICVKEDGVNLEREALACPKCKLKNQIKLMWRRELDKLLIDNKLPKYKYKSKKFVQDTLLERVDNELLIKQMTDMIFERDYTIFDGDKSAASPDEAGILTSVNAAEKKPKVRYRKTKTGIKVKKSGRKRKV